MKHPQFKESPFLYKPSGDRIKFYEITEKELINIYGHVHDKTDYKYEIENGQIVVKEYLEFLKRDDVVKGTKEFQKNRRKAQRRLLGFKYYKVRCKNDKDTKWRNRGYC